MDVYLPGISLYYQMLLAYKYSNGIIQGLFCYYDGLSASQPPISAAPSSPRRSSDCGFLGVGGGGGVLCLTITGFCARPTSPTAPAGLRLGLPMLVLLAAPLGRRGGVSSPSPSACPLLDARLWPSPWLDVEFCRPVERRSNPGG